MVSEAWDGEASAEPSPLQNHEQQLPEESGETGEISEDGDERPDWQAGLVVADVRTSPEAASAAASDRSFTAYLSLLARLHFRPPTVL
jgi:hypothetical protein